MVITSETVYETPIDRDDVPLDETTDDCIVDVKYICTVTNIGPITANINSLSRTLNRNVKYLTPALDTTELVPGDYVLTTETVSIDILQEEKKFSVFDEHR